jgi:hypothetical protein
MARCEARLKLEPTPVLWARWGWRLGKSPKGVEGSSRGEAIRGESPRQGNGFRCGEERA